MKNILIVIGFIGLVGLAGHFDMQDEIKTTSIDKQNKQEFIKDMQVRCMNETVDVDYCNSL